MEDCDWKLKWTVADQVLFQAAKVFDFVFLTDQDKQLELMEKKLGYYFFRKEWPK